MKLFKPLFIGKVDYTDVPHHKSKGWNGTQKRYINRIYIHEYADEARLVEALSAKVHARVLWLIDWCYENIKPTSSIYKVSGTMLSLAIERVAVAKVRKDWDEYASAILNLNTLYIYALEARYDRPCGYTDSSVVIGDNRWGWRGGFVAPADRPFGKIKEASR